MESTLTWIADHPGLALLVLCLASGIEALFVIGLVIPGSVILFAAGALIALGSLDFWTCVLLASAGALAGDCVTFWIGRRYGESLFAIDMLAKRPEILARGRGFFVAHGGKSVLVGRFVGPLRPIMPAIAGAYRMSWSSFVGIDSIAAVLWAITYMIPGVVFGASLNLAAEVATHMVILLSAVVGGIWLVAWLVARCVALGQRHGERWVHSLLDWSARHRRLGRLGSWMADPEQPETLGLLLLSLLIMLAAWLFLYSWWGIGAVYPARPDALAYQVLRDFYTPGAAFVFTAIAMLGEARVYAPVAAAVLLTLLWMRRFRAAAHWIAAVAYATLISVGLYYALPLPDPIDYFGGRSATRFSARDLILASAIYGFVPVLLSTRRKPSVRAWFYGVSTLLILLIASSQVFLGLQWASVAAFAVAMSTLWVACLALGYRRHRAERVQARPFLWIVLLVFGFAAMNGWNSKLDQRLTELQPQTVTVTTSTSAWWQSRYADLPERRIGVAGRPEQALNIQWQGSLPTIREILIRQGWQAPPTLDWRNALRWLTSSTPFDSLPVLPQVHLGQYPSLMMVKTTGEDSQLVIRLWSSGWIIDRTPLWVGDLGILRPNTALPFMRFPAAEAASTRKITVLSPDAPVLNRHVQRNQSDVLLVRPAL